MLPINGKIIATSDTNDIIVGPNISIVYVGDSLEMPKELYQAGAIVGTPFVPDYMLLEIFVNGDILNYRQLYVNSLAAPEAQILFTTLLRALYIGKIVILYFPKDTLELKYPEWLLHVLRSDYGIQAETKSTPFMYNNVQDPSNIEFMYYYNMITADEFLKLFDINDYQMMQDYSLDHIARDLGGVQSIIEAPRPEKIKFALEKREQLMQCGQTFNSAFTIV